MEQWNDGKNSKNLLIAIVPVRPIVNLFIKIQYSNIPSFQYPKTLLNWQSHLT